MRAEEQKGIAKSLFAGNGEIDAVLRAHDWAQTPLGAIETWSDNLKTAVQIRLTELNSAQTEQVQQVQSEQNCAQTTALQESEARYRTLFESIDEGFCTIEVIFDADGKPFDHRIVQANPAFERQSGIANPEGKTASELAPGIEQYGNDLYAQVIHTGESIRTEIRLDALDRWFNVLVSPVGDAATRQVAIVFTDISDRKQAEITLQRTSAELERQVRKFDATLSTITDSVFTFDHEGRILYANQVLLDLWGITAAEAIGKTMTDLNYPPTVERQVLDDLRRVLETRESVRNETPYTNPAGVEGYFEYILSPVFAADHTVESVVGLSGDISDRKRAEAALRQSEEQSRNILESITDAFLSIDENWQFNYVNQTAYTLTGYEPGDLIGKNFWEALPGLADSEFEQMHRRVMRDRVAQSLTAFYPDHDRWYEVRTYPAANGITIYFRNVTEQIKAEEAVRFSEARFRRIFECNMIGMGIWTRSGGITEANDALLDIIGYTQQDLNEGQLNWQKITVPEHADRDQQALAEIAVRRICSSYEKDYLHKQGHRVPILIGAAGFVDDSEAGVFFAVDLSKQKQTEAALRESETRLRFMLDASQIGEWDLDLTTEPHTAHRSLRHDQIFGYESLLPEWSYEIFLTHVHPDDHAAVNQKFQETLSASTNWNFECRIIHPDQSIHWIWVRSSVYCDASGTPTRLLGVVVDITDHKLTEAALRESEELKQSILDSSKDCIKVLTLNSEVVYVSAGGLYLLEIDEPTDILNASWVDFWQGEDYESALIAISAATSGSTGQFRGYLPTYKGTPKWWDNIITPVRNSAGAITQLVVISRDITRQKQAETEREHLLVQEQAAREAAETANRIKDEFLAVLSHELRSPLNPILGWSRLLQTRKFDAARQKDALATIERNAKLQSQLIEDLLDISRIMQGKLTLNAAPVSLAFVISAAVETVSLAAAAKQIQIRLDLDPDMALISGDPARLQQVVWNLLTNAVKFTPRNGQVTVELRQLDSLAQIRVVDTGKGIDLNFLPYVFEYFRQEDGSTTRKFGGLGLGLAIVRQIVELHGGTVTAESQGENQGAAFTVQLPTMQQTIPLIPESIHAQASSEVLLDNVQILLVDDDPDTREFQAFLLEQNGAKVIAAASGLEALQALDQFIPDVIVSDIGMADIDGYMLMQQIRSRPATQGGTIPAIALTAYAAEIDQKRAMQAGFQIHLTKPLEPERFVSVIMNLLKQNRV
ncbi:MAG: PAS domain S-box protein [Gloeocapsa sp. UFS-A4-WI-NPMV-4B04]|jgi:PAS domain S-box-containing protein|nr:PAS domain S-box protein [Gloeocapsa sp. UFS-A4-WI-NPMV-4B04]